MKILDLLRESTDFSEARSKLKAATKAIDAALNHKAILYRGVDIGSFATEVGDLPGDYKLYYVSGLKQPRKSLTGTNLFLDITSTSEAWKDVPRRAWSTFCSVDPSSVGDFGDLQIILPINSVNNLAVCRSDFNMTRFRMMGDKELTVGNFISDVASIAEKSTSMWRVLHFIIDQESQEQFDINAKDNPYLRETLSKISRSMRNEEHFQRLKQDIKNSKLLALLEKHGKILARSIGSQIAKPEAIDAVGEVINGIEKIKESQKDEFERLMNILDYDVNLIYRAEYFLKVFGNFTGSLYAALIQSVTPEKMGIQLASSVEDAINKSDDTSEIWFEGPYFIVSRGPYVPTSRSTQIKIQRYFQVDEVREFFKSI